MLKMTLLDRVLLLITGILAAYQVAVGVDGFSTLTIGAFTIAFGVILVAGLLLIILGFEALDAPVVVIVATLIPLSLASGLAWEYLPVYRCAYLTFVVSSFLAVVATRILPMANKVPIYTLVLAHGVAGFTIFLLPIYLVVSGTMKLGFGLVGLGGALIGVGGLLLSFSKAGRPLLGREAILRKLPALLLATTLCFTAGFYFV